jgi:hypothetical protein
MINICLRQIYNSVVDGVKATALSAVFYSLVEIGARVTQHGVCATTLSVIPLEPPPARISPVPFIASPERAHNPSTSHQVFCAVRTGPCPCCLGTPFFVPLSDFHTTHKLLRFVAKTCTLLCDWLWLHRKGRQHRDGARPIGRWRDDHGPAPGKRRGISGEHCWRWSMLRTL